jgi:hypothetical protein
MRCRIAISITVVSVFLFGTRSAEAGIPDIVCFLAKANPIFWETVAVVVAARDAGLLNTKEDCLTTGDFIGDFDIPTGIAKTCVCDQVSWPSTPPPKPICPVAHTVCAVGSPLLADMPMGSCENGPDSTVGVAVCAADSFCCTNFWDETCVQESRLVFWSAVDQSELPVICQDDNAPLEIAAEAVGNALLCIGPRGSLRTRPICEPPAPKTCGGQFPGSNGCLNQHMRFSYGGAFIKWGGTGSSYLYQDVFDESDPQRRFDFEAPDAYNRFRIKSYQSSLCVASVGAIHPIAIPCTSCGLPGNSCQWTFTGFPSSFTMVKNVGTNRCLWSSEGNAYKTSALPLEERDCVLSPATQIWLDYASF